MVLLGSSPCYLDSVVNSPEGGFLDYEIEFVNKYKERFPDFPVDGFAGQGYDSIYIVLNAAKKFGTDSAVLADEIPRMVNEGMETVSGRELIYTKDKEMLKGMYAYVVENDQFVTFGDGYYPVDVEFLGVELYK